MTDKNRSKYQQTRQVLLRGLSLTLALVWLIAMNSACLPFSLETHDTIVDVEFSDRTQTQTQTQTQTKATTVSSPATEPATLQTTAASGETFIKEVRWIILTGLASNMRTIILDTVVRDYSIPESDVQKTIDQVFAIYQDVYRTHAEYFYLSGSINVGYSLDGQDNVLAGLIIEPVLWPIFAGLAEPALQDLIDEVELAADTLAQEIAAETSVPWRQLQLIHDKLVRLIRYDETMDQDRNQAYSALVEKITLCQGYAQSFALIGQRLGFDIEMITGEADGTGHAWNLVWLDGKPYHVDVTFDDPTPDGGSAAPVQHAYFLRSDAVISQTHTWDESQFAACPQDWAAYYREQNLVVNDRAQLIGRLNDFVAAIDYATPEINRLEILDDSSDLPDSAELEDLVRQALQQHAAGYSVHFSYQIVLDIVIVEISPDA